MAFEQLEKHVAALGGVKRVDGRAPVPLTSAELKTMSDLLGAPLPDPLRWWFSTYGAGVKFVEPVVFTAPGDDEEALLGHFIGVDEIRQTLEDFEDAMPALRLPINDDASGNVLVVDERGAVYEHIHDAPRDRNERCVASSFDKFVLMLRGGE
jgi:hypothetical protein